MTGTIPSLKERYRARWKRWINRRIPASRTVTLDQRRIFIFPTRSGFFFLFTLLIMLLAAINYQNNMIFALVFLLSNLFVIAVLHTFANLSALTITAVRAAPVFAGQLAEYEIMLSRQGRRQHHSVHAVWPGSDSDTVNLTDNDEVHLKLGVPTEQRGWHNPGRLLLETSFPLGILRSWTWVDLEIRALVYPQPLASADLPGISSDRPEGSAIAVEGRDDFFGLRDYQRGDSLKHVLWKTVAKGMPLQSKQYVAYADRSVWLDWGMFDGLPVEQRLSHLCYWALEFDRNSEEYGLRLPGTRIDPALGDSHRLQVLRTLATFGLGADR